MRFRTEIQVKDAPFKLNPERPVLLTGSCFSDNIGRKFAGAGLPVFSNPCGVVYNPVSIALLFQLALTLPAQRRIILADSMTMREGKWVSWFMDSKTIDEDRERALDRACERVGILQRALETSQAVFITFGTPDIYLLKDSDRAVGNCHKHPAAEFSCRRLRMDEICSLWDNVIKSVRELNPDVKFVFTVSPRRYLSKGFEDNSRLKAVLLLAAADICRANEDTLYFPAYEILNDDLRDYRYYAVDMLHPSETAVDYIWEKFCETFFTPEGMETIREGEKKFRRASHIPLSRKD